MRNNSGTNGTNSMFQHCDVCPTAFIYHVSILPYLLFSVPTNGYVLWLMISSPVFRTDRMDMFEFHLVITEILFALLEIILFIGDGVSFISMMSRVTEMAVAARIQFQGNISLERYFAVVHPVLYLRYRPLRYRMSFSCVTWLQTLLTNIPQVIFCAKNMISLFVNIATFLYVFSVNAFCCVAVLRALKQPAPGDGEREASNLIKRRAFNIVLVFLVTTIVSYVPFITFLVLAPNLPENIKCILYPLTYGLMVWLGAVHPIMHLRRARKTQ